MLYIIIHLLKPGSQVFNCQNKHYEKICHFEKLKPANEIAVIKTNGFNVTILSFVFCLWFRTGNNY